MIGLSKSEIRAKIDYYRNYVPSGQVCAVSVMDDSDPDIVFDENGVCNHVHYARKRLSTERFDDYEGQQRLQARIERVKSEGRGKPYDCVVGVSGGVDSTYVAWRCREFGLRPLAVHLDNGWNSNLAVSNIERTLEKLGIDLYTYVVDWEEMKDLQRSVILSGTANLEVVTDHAINATLFRQAAKYGIRTIVTGANVETESMHLGKWHYDNRDGIFIKGLHRKFGTVKLKSFPFMYPWQFLWFLMVRRISTFPILNYGEYNKDKVKQFLHDQYGWQPYQHKHGESIYTRFFQEYYLPTRFGFDKRKLHFSSLIVAGQMTRGQALAELEKPLLEQDELEEEIEYVIKKLGFDRAEWDRIMSSEKRYYFEYPNAAWMLNYDNAIVQHFRKLGKGESRIVRDKQSIVADELTDSAK